MDAQKPYEYHRLIHEALSMPWCITEDMAAVIWDLLRFRAMGGRLTAEEIRARIGAADPAQRPQPSTRGGIAVIPIYGVIAHRTFEASSGMTSTDFIGAQLRRALADEEIGTILFDIASPGGVATGIGELAAEILAAREQKHIVAAANGLMASAAIWLGAQATEVVAIPSADVGSIGVYSLHEDWSGWLEKQGIKIEALKFGDRKVEGAPWESLDDEARAHFQGQVNEVGRQFQAGMAKGRGVSLDVVKKQFGDGRVFKAKEAKVRGLIDSIETMPDLLARLAGKRRRRSGYAAAAAQSTGPVVGANEAGELVEAGKPVAAGDDLTCESCNGTGLKPERVMSDPQGQEPCPDCDGTGKKKAVAVTAAAVVLDDVDAALSIAERS